MKDHDAWLIDFGARLRKERERQGLTRLALADLAHTEQGYIVQIERGDRSPSLRTFINLLSALGSSADYLIFGTTGEEELDDMSEDFKRFLFRQDHEEIKVLFEIARLVVKYKDIGIVGEALKM